MNTLDWIMLGLYLVVAVVATIRVHVCGVVGYNHTGNQKVEMALLAIGLPVALYLLIRHPWMCLLWFAAGSIASILWHLVGRKVVVSVSDMVHRVYMIMIHKQ